MRLRDEALVFLEPAVVKQPVECAVRLRERCPNVSLVVYTALNPQGLHDVANLANEGFGELVILGYDDSPERLTRLAADSCAAFRYAKDLELIEPVVGQLPERMGRAVQDLFRNPRRYRSTLDLASAAGVSSRAVFRHLKAAGFRSPRRLVASARVIRAFHLLSGSRRSGHEVANLLGYRSVDQLSQHFSELAGCTASDVRRGNAAPDLPGRVLRSLIAHAERRPDQQTFAYAD